MQIMESLTWANNKLKEAGVVDAPMLDAQLLLAYVLDRPKNYLFTHMDQPLSEAALERFEQLIDRRARHEPVAYILGWKDFYKRPFVVNPFVLIPRPETEQVVEAALQEATGGRDTVFIDIGTGSGAIAVTLAAESGLPVIAIDVSDRALAVARQNAAINNVDDRITFVHGSLIDPIDSTITKPLERVVLVANLPYLSTRQWTQSQADVHDYEPRLALDGGVDGLELYNDLFRSLQLRRADFPAQLSVVFEIDPDQRTSAPSVVKHYFPNAEVRVLNDLTNRARIIVAHV
jgi:release factor glutamine methyltransferase